LRASLLSFGRPNTEENIVTEFFHISPEAVETGVPVTISIDSSSLPAKTDTISVFRENSPYPIRAELVAGPAGTFITQFALYDAGKYRLSLGSHEQTLIVTERRDLSFFFEVGALTFSVACFLGGLILWSQKAQKPKAGSSSHSGPS
jgi:hypothetical protein